MAFSTLAGIGGRYRRRSLLRRDPLQLRFLYEHRQMDAHRGPLICHSNSKYLTLPAAHAR